jgi:hypothetical protein
LQKQSQSHPNPSEHSNTVHDLTHRIQSLEQDILTTQSNATAQTNNSNPLDEKYIYLLRDLRGKVHQLQSEYMSKLDQERDHHHTERAQLLSQLHDLQSQQQQQQEQLPAQEISMKTHYETLVYSLEKEYQQHSKLFQVEIHRLEDILQQKNDVIQHLTKLTAQGKNIPNEVFHLQQLYRTSQQQVDKYHHELDNLQLHFSQYKRIQDQLIANLEQQVDDVYSSHSHGSDYSIQYQLDEVDSRLDLDERVRSLEFKYKSKCAELETVMKAINHIGEVGETSLPSLHLDQGDSRLYDPTPLSMPPPPPEQGHTEQRSSTTSAPTQRNTNSIGIAMVEDVGEEISDVRNPNTGKGRLLNIYPRSS